MSYGLPDDEYFFLKVMDLSRANTNQKQQHNNIASDIQKATASVLKNNNSSRAYHLKVLGSL